MIKIIVIILAAKMKVMNIVFADKEETLNLIMIFLYDFF